MRLGRRRIAALTAGLVGIAALAAGAVAATSGSSDPAGDLAAAINTRAGTSITAADVTGAYLDVLKARLDEAVAAGSITQAQADEMLQRAKDDPGIPGGFGFGGRDHDGPGHVHADILAPVAKSLSLSEAQLRTKLEAGATLAAVAKTQGVSRADLIATISAALKTAGVPAARIADLAVDIADDTHPGHGPGGRHGGPWGPPHP